MATDDQIERLIAQMAASNERQSQQHQDLIDEMRKERQTNREFYQAFSGKLDDRFNRLEAKLDAIASLPQGQQPAQIGAGEPSRKRTPSENFWGMRQSSRKTNVWENVFGVKPDDQ